MVSHQLSNVSSFCLERINQKRGSSHKDPGLVAWHPGAPHAAAHGSQGLHHPALVEDDPAENAGEEAASCAAGLRTEGEGSDQAPVLGAHVARPLAILPGAPRYLRHPVPLAVP